MKRGALGRAIAVAVAVGLLAPAHGAAAPQSPPECRGSASGQLDALQLLELQISYTTLVARYYLPVDTRLTVRGAHAGMEALLKRCGVADRYPRVVNARQDGAEQIDSDFLTILLHYGRDVDSGSLVRAAIAGEMMTLHDPYTELFPPPELRSFNKFLQGEEFGGVGLVLDAERARPRVATVIPGGPAAKAGVLSGDVIYTIDGNDSQGKTTAQLRDLLRGKAGSVAHIVVGREVRTGTSSEFDKIPFEMKREVVRDPQTLPRMIGSDVGYVQLTRFGDDAAIEVSAAVADLTKRGATRFILDLRDNGGGFGDAATGVTSVFVPSGIVFTMKERLNPPTVERAHPGSSFHFPLVVLVNHNTASASEIVAGALQDDRAATIVGVRTFGKGVVQSVFDLPDNSAIKMTTARYYTPSGRNIDKIGITPDVVVAEPADVHFGVPAFDPQLARALEILAAPTSPSSITLLPTPTPTPTPTAMTTLSLPTPAMSTTPALAGTPPVPVSTEAGTPLAVPVATVTAVATPIPMITPRPTLAATATPSATPTPTATPTETPTPTPTTTPTPAPSATPTPTPAPAATPAPSAMPTPVPTATPTPVPTATPASMPTPAPTPMPSSSAMPQPTPNPTPAPLPSATPAVAPSPLPTFTPAPVITASAIPTVSPAASSVPTSSATATSQPTDTPTDSGPTPYPQTLAPVPATPYPASP